MSRQVTLFGSWAKDSTDERTKGEAPSTSTGNQQAYNYDDIQLDSLDDFFEDDVAEEIQTIQDNKDNLDKSSLYEEIPGFDLKAGETFIYPTNYPTRDYQFNIVKKCLYRNTLVSLPTGLGKTFIAAVVMYNFYRWYPTKKIVFMAPTKPLVSQQIEACYNIMGISQGHSAEMTGAMLPKERVTQWQIKRVFYLTPQVFQNDLGRGTCPATDVCCVIFDEAHKALGNHAYCQVIKGLRDSGAIFRVIALSATPGSDLKAVQQVIDNLMIAHVEVRSEESLDVQQFTHQRKVEIIVVDLKGDIMDIVISFKKVLAGVIGRLASEKLIYTTDIDRLSKFQLLQARQKFRDTTAKGVMSSAIEGDFALAISLLHGYELLLQHGMRSFYVFLDQNVNNNERKSRALAELLRNPTFKEIMSTLHDKVIGSKDVAENSLLQLNSSMYCPSLKQEGRFFYSHPKLNKLEAVVVSFFNSNNADSKVMIFSQYRESVCEIADMLSYHAPLVRVMCFIGHSSTTGKASKGQTHKEQIEVVHKFRQGGYNVLVSTCVGEEGLDIGEVDMIVCFDAHKSPVRLVQRMGRTGRKREGKIVVIVSKGKEEQVSHRVMG
jgi:Fanconi anemia group M protein